MKTNVKNKIIILLFTAVFVLTFALFYVSVKTSYADDPVDPVTVSTSDFWLDDGQRIRVSEDGNGFGYTFRIKTAAYNAYNGAFTDVKYGIIIAPSSYTINVTNVFGENAIYNWNNKVDGEWETYVPEVGKTRIANFVAEAFEDDTVTVNQEEVAVKYFHGSLINIKTENIAVEFCGYAYVGYSADGENYDYEIVSKETNVRSMAYTSQLAIANPEEDDDIKTMVQETYLDNVASVASSFTVNNYFRQPNGTYVLDEGKTQVVNSTIDATPSYITSFTHYEFDEDNANNSIGTKVLANDRLVIVRYYNPVTYTVTYSMGDRTGDAYADVTPDAENVEYGSSTEALPTVACEGYFFRGWRIAGGDMVTGTYAPEDNVTLTAVWEKDDSSERWGSWTPLI